MRRIARLSTGDLRPRPAALLALVLLAACSFDPAPPDNLIVVDTRAAAPKPIAAPSPAPLPATPPAAAVAARPAMQPRKAFTDPPLPPELRDDGGLTPLPPPPPSSGNHP